nr:reverse transcriptase domain-containing protein [Tanacetum cinerariifolium]
MKAEAAFKQMKKLITELPTLTAPVEKEELIVYLAAAREAFTYALRFEFDTTNNEAEYEALIAGLRITKQIGIKNLQRHVDSCLVANQVNGSYIAKEPGMIQYMGSFAHLTKQVLVEVLKEKSKNEAKILKVMEEEGNNWMIPIYEYLTKETLHAERKKARAVRLKSRCYAVINGVLYKKFFLELWLRCVGPLQANYVLREIHEGSCSMHARPRSMVANAIRTGDKPLKDWCEKLNIHHHFASVKHPQTNSLVKRANKSLGERINARLEKISKDWTEEVPIKREQATIHEARSKAKIEKYYNSKVHNISFKPGDLVYRNNDASHAEDSGKLGPKWEGPYEVTKALGKRTYKLRDRNRKLLLRTWNVRNLKKCYVHEM